MSEIDLPEYHEEGMGCGLEDQHITNRYEACRYGFEQAIDACYAEVIEPLERQLEASRQECERLREGMEIEIGDFIIVDDEPQFVSGIVSDPVLRIYYWQDNQELSVTEGEIDCHFLNMNRFNEDQLTTKNEGGEK
jgi:hypothetical protein